MAEDEALLVESTTSEDIGVVFADLRTRLRNYLRRRVSDPFLVEDLVQDIFVKASAAVNANQAPNNLTGWLYAAARTTVADYYRTAHPEPLELDENLPDSDNASDELLHQELAICLRPLTRQLPAIYRDTLLATDFNGKTMQTLADEQGLSLSAIKSRASRARYMLKAKLLDCCHVEMSGGLVTDYYCRSTNPPCGGGCA
ncbi:MAG TPA: sigma-70 family RNA polymerase sigma factor [Methylotenera sp.]|nr:sigma-70 family RNA polymerase sigma factor [Methylotenera sp.]HPH05618.1 sigma-70 family RNA polymerase sigma factor [Methylotenera sp.]HPN01955.1 sigma-70 family RNA polymerase sigma factor [Methylotenera sp.]